MSAFLIADDSPEKTRFLVEMVGRSGWVGEILTVDTTEEALRIIAEKSDISVAFIDYYIPKKCGPAIIRALKAKFPECRIALVSSADSHSNADEARAAGVEAVICTTHQADVVEKQLLDFLGGWKEDETRKK